MTRRTKAALVAGLMALSMIVGAGAAYADDVWLTVACAIAEAAYGRGSLPWEALGCAALDHPNPQA